MIGRTIYKDLLKIWAYRTNLVLFVISKDDIRCEIPTDSATSNCQNPRSYIPNDSRVRSFISSGGNYKNPALRGKKCSNCNPISNVFFLTGSKWHWEDIDPIMNSSFIASQHISIATAGPADLVWSDSRVGRTSLCCSISWTKQVCPRNKTTSSSG